jgi:anionic cell wall polymer biosynthesis LytR-Cps2A-Psr (LCP) family protein
MSDGTYGGGAQPPRRPRRSDVSPKERRRGRSVPANDRGNEVARPHVELPQQAPATSPGWATEAPAAPQDREAESQRPQQPPAVPLEDLEPSPPDTPPSAAAAQDPEPATTPADPATLPPPSTAPSTGARMPTKALLGVLAVVVLAGGVLIAIFTGVFDRALELVSPDEPSDLAVDEFADLQPTLLLVTADETDTSGLASAVTMLAVDRETGEGTVLLVPTATLADVPGHGSFQLREAYSFGGGALVAASFDNLLGVRTDGVADVSQQGWAALLTRVGGFEVDVRQRLVEETADGNQVRFEAGPQFLDGPRLAEYLTFRQEGETELEALPRTQQVVLGMLDRFVAEPELLDEVFADGAPMIDGADPALTRDVLEGLVAARAEDRVTTLTLPVEARGTGRDDIYTLDRGRADALVSDRLAASVPADGVGVGRDLQVLNGNGVPGVGEQVADRLLDGGYRILVTGNAGSFDYDTTRIIVHDDTDEQLAAARDIQERLGTGVIERAGTPQSVGDITIIVGADFP